MREEFRKKFEEISKDKGKTAHDSYSLEAEEHYIELDMQETVEIFHSDRLLERAAACDVDAPSLQDKAELWKYSEDGERYFLNAAGRAHMRDLLQKEEDRNFQKWARWAPIIGTVTGLIGVIIGLVAFFRHPR
ncbi:MAG TPA: hypothetical protein VN087_02700 [Verrucomicrobiae bacterium]|nr:hypothetical protein [Verrucomicrobiae bacterium]